MSLFQIIYVSHPFGFDDAMLNGILTVSRRNNLRDDVTGALICRADTYLQLIEGPEVAIPKHLRTDCVRRPACRGELSVRRAGHQSPLPRMGHA